MENTLHIIPRQRSCSKCGEEKPATTEFFAKRKKGSGGLRAQCRDCINEKRQARRKADQDKSREDWREEYYRRRDRKGVESKEARKSRVLASPTKVCSRCGEEKLKKEFPKNKALATFDKRSSYCRDCSKDAQKETRDRQQWATRLVCGARERHQKRGCDEEFDLTTKFIESLFEEQEGRCPWFGVRMTKPRKSGPSQASLDRIDNSRGYTRDNVRLVCKAANLSRNNLTQEEFMNFLDAVEASISRRMSHG